MAWEFVYATPEEIDQLNYNEKKAIRSKGRALLRGELGCFASHYKCWKKFIDDDESDVLMVVEDDVYLDPAFNFIEIFNLMLNVNIDYLRFYSREFRKSNFLTYLGHRQIVRLKDTAWGTQCYAITKTGASKLIKMAEKGVSRPIDDEMDRFWSNQLPNYALFPYPVLELTYPSTIRDKETPISAKGLDRKIFMFNLRKDDWLRKIHNVYLRKHDKKLKSLISTYK